MKKNQKIVFISIYCALALVLDYIKAFIPFLNMPSGGSINIALIPVVVSSFHLGVKEGMSVGLLWWLVSSILGLNPYYINIYQYIVDYILPSVVIGASALFYSKKNVFEIEIGITAMMLIRTFLLVLSGALFWTDGVSSNSYLAWSASALYNVPYCIATTIMLLIIVPIIINSIKKYML